jgi:hypothetical protein
MEQKKEKALEKLRTMDVCKAKREKQAHIQAKVDSKMTQSAGMLFDSTTPRPNPRRRGEYMMKLIAPEESRQGNVFERPFEPEFRASDRREPWKKRVSLKIQNMSWGLDFKTREVLKSTAAIPRYNRSTSVSKPRPEPSSFADFDHLFQTNALFKAKEKELDLIRSSVFKRSDCKKN